MTTTKANSTKSIEAEESTDSLSKTEKRAKWEGFEFRVPCEGTVRVENVSYGEESDEHVTVVTVSHGEAESCGCKAHEYQDGPCKHMRAVEDQPAVLLAASTDDSEADETAIDIQTDVTVGETETTEPQTVADGGQPAIDAPETDHWDKTVEQYPDKPVGAGERCECECCGERCRVALVAATADTSASKWEEFYECLTCLAKGSFRVTDQPATRTWTGQIDYPDAAG